MAEDWTAMAAQGAASFLEDDGFLYVAVAIAVALVLIAVAVAARLLRGTKRDTVLLLGLCDAGKTALFYALKTGKWVPTCTSMAENAAQIPLDRASRVVPVIDLPGHERLRLKNIERHSRTARAIVFVVDSVHFPAQKRQVAELIHDVLADRAVHRARIPVLVACNKSEIVTARDHASIKADIEKEIDTLRMTQAAAVAGQDGAAAVEFLGDRNRPFVFSQLRNSVEFAPCSVKEANIAPVVEFLRRVAK
eukprot:Opistho-1_new@4055